MRLRRLCLLKSKQTHFESFIILAVREADLSLQYMARHLSAVDCDSQN